jgi:glycosyltransferase involved in cell wall biosynthesis
MKPAPTPAGTIAQITSYYPPHLGGMENAVQEIAVHQAAQGDSVEVLTSDIGGTPGRTAEDGVTVHRLRSAEIAHTPIIWGLFTALMRLKNPVAFHVHTAQALVPETAFLASRLRRVPLVLHVHADVGTSGGLAGRFLPLYKRFFLGPVLRRAEAVLAPSAAYQAILMRKYRLPHVGIMPNGVGEQFFTKKPTPSLDPIRLVFVGRLSVEKNVSLLIETVAGLGRPVVLDIIGDGPLRTDIEHQINRLPTSSHAAVNLLGFKPKTEIIPYYQQALAVLLPSDYEIQPLTALEAMAGGTPVIGSKADGIVDTLGDAGLTADKTPAAFRAAIVRLADDTKLWHTLSQRSLAKAKALTWAGTATRLRTIYDRLSTGSDIRGL